MALRESDASFGVFNRRYRAYNTVMSLNTHIAALPDLPLQTGLLLLRSL